MIKDLELKLSGSLPVRREELFELVSSHGRKNDFMSIDYLEIEKCKPKECYDLSNLNVSQINDLSYIFRHSMYNGDLSKWNTSNCIDFFGMFLSSEFNNDSLKDWNTSNVINLNKTFYLSNFNGDLSGWNTSNVININSMFESSEFNNNSISNWNTSNIQYMVDVFYNSKFNGDISKWDVYNCSSFKRMFAHSKFDGDISSWQFNKYVNCQNMFDNNFYFASKYNNKIYLDNDTNDFLEWFEENRDKIRDINTPKEEILDFFYFDLKNNLEINK